MFFYRRTTQILTKILGRHRAWVLHNWVDYLRMRLSRNTPILVYQMGKVGSQSVYYSLLRANYFPVLFFHYVAQLEQERFPHYQYLKQILNDKSFVKIVTLVRDPVARNLSAFAHDFKGIFGSRMQSHSLAELEDMFWQYDRHLQGVQWFDEEFHVRTGIDVYSYPFDKERGFSVIQQGPIALLVLKLECPDAQKEYAIGQFVGIPNFRLKRFNTAMEREYKANYKEFISAIHLPELYLDNLYGTKFVGHFYSEKEIEGFKKRWRQGRRSQP